MALRVLHLAGSPTSEFWAELSRVYAADCLSATASMPGVEPVLAWIEPGGGWRFPADLSKASTDAGPTLPLSAALDRIEREQIDVMLPQLFCRAGMTHLRTLFDVAGIPYVGNSGEVMAIGADKALTRTIVAAAGVDVPEAVVVGPGETPHVGAGPSETPAVVVGAGESPEVELPVVVKPVDGDNSEGVSLVRDPVDLPAALAEALAHSSQAIVEQYVPAGREVRCGVLDLGSGLVPLPLEEYRLDPATPIRGTGDKLAGSPAGGLQLVAKSGELAWIVPADDPIVPAVQTAALSAHRALGCRDYSLFDFRVDPAGRPWLIEAGLYCSFAEQSVITTMARAEGWTAPELLSACIEHALRRRTEYRR